MPSAMHTMGQMQLHHGRGLLGVGLGTLAGAASGFAIGVGYGKWHGHWYGKWLPAFAAAGGKVLALGAYLLSRGRLHTLPIVLNDVGQAGIDILAFGGGTHVGLKWAGKQLTVKDEKASLGPGEVKIAGELPPAVPGRSLENITVEDMANLE